MSETLTAEEARFFESGGEVAPASGAPAAAPEPAAQAPEPAPAPEAAQQPQEPPATQEKGGTLDERTHAAVVAERERRKAAEKAAREAEIRAAQMEARLQERLQMIQQAMPQPAQPQAEPIEFAKDPEGWIKANFQQVQQELQAYRQFQQQIQQQSQQQRAVAELQNWGRVQESEFAQQTPDYGEAANHLRDSRDRELMALGITDPLQRQQMLAQDVLQLTMAARQSGANVAERIYQLAKMRGYAPKAAAAPAPAVPPITVAPAAPAPDLATIARGQAMAAGLGTAGAAPPPRLTADALLKMTDAEFAKIMATDEGRALLGG